MEPGYYTSLTNAEYHGGAGHSSTGLKKFLRKTPQAILYEKVKAADQESNAAYNLGSAVHGLILEPHHFERDFAVSDVWNLRTKEGRAQRDQFERECGNRTIINLEQYAQAQLMAQAALQNPVVKYHLAGTCREYSFYWKQSAVEDAAPVLLKVRPDAISTAGADVPTIYDVKTCASAAYGEFQRDIVKYLYHVSAAMYLHGVNSCKAFLDDHNNGRPYENFAFICIEKEPPYQVALYNLSPQFLHIGNSFYRAALMRLQMALELDWPGYPTRFRMMDPPSWADRLDEV